MSLTGIAAAARRSSALPFTLTVAAVDVDGGEAAGVQEDGELPLASVGKLMLLSEVAARLDDGRLDAGRVVAVDDAEVCGGSGLLRHLGRTGWTVSDLAWMTAAVSDNTATNALLRTVGREAVNASAARHGLPELTVHDRIRDERGPGLPPTFATGTARGLARLVALAATGALHSAGASARLLGWMRANTDHGLVPALIDHDPDEDGFPTPVPDRLMVANKTGTDSGIRTDAGLLVGRRRLAYAVLAHWDPELGPGTERAAIHAIREVGRALAAAAMR